MQKGTANLIVTKGFQMEDVLINGHEGTLFVPDDPQDMKSLTLMDPEENIQFTLNASLPKKDILLIVETLSLVKSTKLIKIAEICKNSPPAAFI